MKVDPADVPAGMLISEMEDVELHVETSDMNTNHDPHTGEFTSGPDGPSPEPGEIPDPAAALAKLPEHLQSEAGARAHFEKKMYQESLFHEAPGDVVEGMKQGGIHSTYGTFAAIGKTSHFVTGEQGKTIAEFRISKSEAKHAALDMPYHAHASLSPEHVALITHGTSLRGARVSISGAIKPSQLVNVKYHSSTSASHRD